VQIRVFRIVLDYRVVRRLYNITVLVKNQQTDGLADRRELFCKKLFKQTLRPDCSCIISSIREKTSQDFTYITKFSITISYYKSQLKSNKSQFYLVYQSMINLDVF